LSLEPLERGVAFIGVLALMLAAEAMWPKRPRLLSRRARWVTNLSLMGAGTAVSRLMAMLAGPITATGAAAFADARGIGILHWLDAPAWLAVLATLLVLDLAVWAQHWAFHKSNTLWRLHSVHHADREIDATTALRFHPFEIGLSAFFKSAVVLALGAPVAAVVLFEVLLNACAMFNHANTSLPRRLEQWVRLFVVTPDLHRIHHSVRREEQDSNFGFCLSLWDRIFGLLRTNSLDGDLAMHIGLAEYQDQQSARLGWSLALPFAAKVARTRASTFSPRVHDE
jgi:sterol desaturase/sphingolipid hydroxylase (fatty acid hydroxylase superfamily)